jgi:HEAT repeat protein
MVALLPLTLLFITWARREPSHDGRTLSEWLSQPYDGRVSGEETARAVRAMGTRVLPTLLDWLKTRESRTKRVISALAGRQPLIQLRFESAEERRGIAVAGLYVLATNAAPAIPALAVLIEDTELGAAALNGLAAIGLPAWPELLAALTNSHREVRSAAANWLSHDPFVEMPGTMEALLRLLHDPEAGVQSAAVHTLVNCGKYPELIQPAFVALAADTNYPNRAAVVSALANSTVDPRIGLKVFLTAMENGDAGLARIATEEVIEPFITALDDTEPAVRAKAASTLGRFPQQTARILPLLHARLTNDYPVVRAGAASGLAKLGSAARVAVPDLIRLYESDDRRPVLKISAARALLAIDPATAARVGIKPWETPPLWPGTNASIPPGRRGGWRTNSPSGITFVP